MYLDGMSERARDQLAEHAQQLAEERAEENLWRASLIGQRLGMGPLTVLEVLQENDRITVETEPLP